MAEGNNMQGEQITVSVCFNHLLNLSDITVAYISSACVRSVDCRSNNVMYNVSLYAVSIP